MIKRIELTRISSGIETIYRNTSGQYLDLQELSTASSTSKDIDISLHLLRDKVLSVKGIFRISDMFRDWTSQELAHDQWIQGKRSSYAAPPGYSWHASGRAIDIDVNNLNISLNNFWNISKALGWEPIIAQPNALASECWHFQYPGPDWSRLKPYLGDGHLAMHACIDSGTWDEQDKLVENRFVQVQLNRICEDPAKSLLKVDGIAGSKTLERLRASCSADQINPEIIQQLVNKPTPK